MLFRSAYAFRNGFSDPIPVHDLLRNLSPGEFFILHRDAAVFAKGVISDFGLRRTLAPNTYFDHRAAAEQILKTLQPVTRKEFSEPLGPPLPVELLPLTELNSLEALPGGHVFLSAALKALSNLTGDGRRSAAHSKPTDEIMEIGV